MKAIDDAGSPAPAGTPFQLFAEGLIINQESAATDASGEATVQYQAAFAPVDVEVCASVGYTEGTVQNVEVRNLTSTGPSPIAVQQLCSGRRSNNRRLLRLRTF